MILMNYKGSALHPFPCPISIVPYVVKENGTAADMKGIACGPDGNFIIAAYHELAPAKMEIQRLLAAYTQNPDDVFTFMKDPFGGGE